MTDPIPEDVIYEALRELDDPGEQAADWFATGFAQIAKRTGRSGNLIAYCGREALMALLRLGGVRPPGLGEAVDKVLAAATAVSSRDAGDQTVLLEALAALNEQRNGPGPHRQRLGALIFEITQRQPVEVKRDLFDRYVATLDGLNRLTHNATPASADDSEALLREAFEIAGRLFAPISTRIESIDALVGLDDPSTDDVDQLLGWLGDPRMASYFFSRLKSPAWFNPLADHELLRPPADIGLWPALVYLRTLAETHPHELKGWLAGQPAGRDLTTQQAFHFLQLARSVAAPIDAEVLHILRGHFESPNVLQLLDAYLIARPTSGQDTDSTFGLIKEALQALADNERIAGGSYITGRLLRRTVSLAAEGDAERWLGVLCAKTRALLGDSAAMSMWAIRRIQAIPRLAIDDGTHRLDQFVAMIRELLRVAESAGVSAEARHGKLRSFPSPLAGRLIATDLLAANEFDPDAAVALLATEVAESDPMPETLALLRRVREADVPGLAEAMATVLGTGPDAEAAERLADDQEIPRPWGSAFAWSAELPAEAVASWLPAIAVCRMRWGEPSELGLILPPPTAVWRSKESPYPEAELKRLPALEAAAKVAAWTPDTNDDFGPSRYGLSNVLKEVVEADPSRWLSDKSAEITRTLGHPVFLLSYFQGLTPTGDDRLPTLVLDAIEAAVSVYRQEGDRQDRNPEGPSWSAVWTTALPLLRRLGLTESDTRARVWTVLTSLANPSEAANPGMPTIYAAVIGAAVSVADITAAVDEPPPEFVALLNAALALDAPLGESVRDVLGANLSWLVSHFPSWTAAEWHRLAGESTSDPLGDYTFRAYLQRGRPFSELMLRCSDRMWAAMRTIPDAAQIHILHGMLWGVAGYEPDVVVGKLAAASDTAVSAAAQWLACTTNRSDDMELAPVLAFWECAAKLAMPTAQYEGFGYFAAAERLDDDAWLDLTLATARLCSSGLEQASQIARRASEHQDDLRAAWLIAALLRSRLDLWEVFEIGRIGVDICRRSGASDPAAMAELRERLLEREFFEVRDENDSE
jgi:hypothetical protein